jgi:hypothetical protein
MGQPIDIESPGEPDRDQAITNALIFLFTRKADRYVATAMDLVPHTYESAMRALDLSAMLVQKLDGQAGAQLSVPQAAAEIKSTVPVMLYLTGRTTWSGYALRRAEFDELQALASLIYARVQLPGPFCQHCLGPHGVQHACTATQAAA